MASTISGRVHVSPDWKAPGRRQFCLSDKSSKLIQTDTYPTPSVFRHRMRNAINLLDMMGLITQSRTVQTKQMDLS